MLYAKGTAGRDKAAQFSAVECCALPAYPLTICSQRLNLILNLDQVLVLQAGRVWCWTHYCPAQPSPFAVQAADKGKPAGIPPLSLRALSPIPHAMGFSSPSVHSWANTEVLTAGLRSPLWLQLSSFPQRGKWHPGFLLGNHSSVDRTQRLPQNQASALPFFAADTQGGVSETGAHLFILFLIKFPSCILCIKNKILLTWAEAPLVCVPELGAGEKGSLQPQDGGGEEGPVKLPSITVLWSFQAQGQVSWQGEHCWQLPTWHS